MPPSTQPIVLRLWDSAAPGATGETPGDIPTLTLHPASQPDGSCIIVCPGGGYAHHAAHENQPVADWLNTLGITAASLIYRVAPYRHPAPLLDGQRAIRLLRSRAAEWSLDPARIGILGFSAGGHLAATVSTLFDDGNANSPDIVDRPSSRPDLSILLYPVITMSQSCVHAGSRENLLGKQPPADLAERLSPERNVTERTPPAFLFHTTDDPGVNVENSLLYASALRRAAINFEMHIFEHGRHGVGLAIDDPALHVWPSLCATWLGAHGFGRAKH